MAHNHALKVVSHEKVSASGTSAQSAAFAASIYFVRIVSDEDCFIEFGSNPTSTTSKIFLPSKDVEYFKVSPGEKVAVILASGTGNLHVSQLSE